MSEVLNPSKAAGIDKLSVKILNSRVDILARSITVISLSNLIRSPEVLKFQNSNHFFKRAPTLILKTIVQFHYSRPYQKLVKGLLMTKHRNVSVKTKFLTHFNLVFEKTILLTLVSDMSYWLNHYRYWKRSICWNSFNSSTKGLWQYQSPNLGKEHEMSRLFKKCNWFKSYLIERTYIINFNTSYSSPSNLTCSVPQGSILAPVVCLLYINDLKTVVSDSLLYANDTSIVFQHKNVTETEKQLLRKFM